MSNYYLILLIFKSKVDNFKEKDKVYTSGKSIRP